MDMAQRFADEQAQAFDAFGYPYYSGEWNENWFPGYSDAWAALRGAQGILYEQARIADDGVQRHTHLLSYRQSVHHQLLSTFANLEHPARNRSRCCRTAFADRAELVESGGPLQREELRVPAEREPGPDERLLELLAIQEIETHRLTGPFASRKGHRSTRS